jgi:hypothetical protein
MRTSPGVKLGSYEILASIGKAAYRAKGTKLKRES